MHDDEPVLLERCRAGDGVAFGVLIERHQGALFGLARRVTGDRDQAQDVLQDSCAKAWTAIGSMRGGSFKSWMSTIVARTSLDHVRARRQVDSLDGRADDEGDRVIPLPDPRPGPEAVAVAGRRVRMIEAALAELSAEHRAIVLLRDLSGLSYDEIASTLRVPIGTVRSRLARARVALQAELLRQDPDILEALG